MLLVGVNGSPHKDGNTKLLLEKVLQKAEGLGTETKLLHADELIKSAKHPFCIVCSNPCSGVCYRGTKLDEAFELMRKADGIIFGSPVYFGGMSGQLKALFDKMRKLRNAKAFYNKVGAGVTVGGSKYGGQETTMRALHDAMLINGMIIVGDGYIDDDCGHYGVSAHKPSADDQDALKRADVLAKRMVEVCRAMASIRK